jgi:hypothetical protein
LIAAITGTAASPAASTHALYFWDTATGRELISVKKDGDWLRSLAFAPDGKILATGSGIGHKGIRLWDTRTGKELPSFVDEEGPMIGLTYSPDGRLLACCRHNGKDPGFVCLWEAATGKKIRTFSAEDDGSGKPVKLTSLAFSPDGKMVAACGYFPRIHIWDVATGKAISQLDGANRQGRSVAFSPDGHMLASTGDAGVVELWEVATGQRRKAWVAHPGKCMSLQFAPDGRSLATGGYDTTAIIWDPTGLRTHDAAKTIPKLSAKELDKSWAELAGQDAAAAYAAMCTLVAAPQDSVAFLRARLHPSPEISKERLQTLFTNLANSEFSVRQAAFNELKELGETITDHLRRATAENPELEVKRRVELLLEAARVPRADMLRRIRAIEVLEYIGSDDARQLLATISRGFPYARETKDAKAALERLAKRTRKRL